ncbi:hypothetical protein BKA80DRAFT_127265 [Phyllosticta citrichinensis]
MKSDSKQIPSLHPAAATEPAPHTTPPPSTSNALSRQTGAVALIWLVTPDAKGKLESKTIARTLHTERETDDKAHLARIAISSRPTSDFDKQRAKAARGARSCSDQRDPGAYIPSAALQGRPTRKRSQAQRWRERDQRQLKHRGADSSRPSVGRLPWQTGWTLLVPLRWEVLARALGLGFGRKRTRRRDRAIASCRAARGKYT